MRSNIEVAIPNGQQQISKWLKDVIINHRKGLQEMYGETEVELDKSLKVPITKGVEMARKLVGMGCNIEVAKNLTLLTLYDVAVLIDDSSTMKYGENGMRKETLIQFLDHITEIFSMANESGILAIRFMNSYLGKENWTGESRDYLDQHDYGGQANIGVSLHTQILMQFAFENPNQSKPLLVLIVTDSGFDGVKRSFLKIVIRNCVRERERAGKGGDAVSFQFSRIGNDPSAALLLIDLDQDPDLREHIDVLPGEFKHQLEEDMWFVLPKILLGAILPKASGQKELLQVPPSASQVDGPKEADASRPPDGPSSGSSRESSNSGYEQKHPVTSVKSADSRLGDERDEETTAERNRPEAALGITRNDEPNSNDDGEPGWRMTDATSSSAQGPIRSPGIRFTDQPRSPSTGPPVGLVPRGRTLSWGKDAVMRKGKEKE
ncbi:hypothetical protein B9Z19DRAFT_973456 [Tuber borchii]|uniref:VWFA domain-containing protein n=1 Tax=Tuber borchii TaxID=42251 RepID=A0A2T6ZZE2_TUBBO|nr:hypothetical protein B9Z19DRAFT_973456 [Tuber borchii]